VGAEVAAGKAWLAFGDEGLSLIAWRSSAFQLRADEWLQLPGTLQNRYSALAATGKLVSAVSTEGLLTVFRVSVNDGDPPDLHAEQVTELLIGGVDALTCVWHAGALHVIVIDKGGTAMRFQAVHPVAQQPRLLDLPASALAVVVEQTDDRRGWYIGGWGPEMNDDDLGPSTPLVATAHTDGFLRVWDIEGRQRRLIDPQQGPLTAVATAVVGPYRQTVAGGEDGSLVPWWMTRGDRLRTPMRGHDAPVSAISTRGETCFSADRSGAVCCWELSTGKLIGRYESAHDGAIRALVPVASSTVITLGDDGRIRATVAGGAPLNQLEIPVPLHVASLEGTNWQRKDSIMFAETSTGESVPDVLHSGAPTKGVSSGAAPGHESDKPGPPLWARLLFAGLIVIGFYGILLTALLANPTPEHVDGMLKVASGLGPLLGVVTGAMAAYFFTADERQNLRIERGQNRQAQVGMNIAIGMMSDDEVEQLKKRIQTCANL
jgi:hypothetical protein